MYYLPPGETTSAAAELAAQAANPLQVSVDFWAADADADGMSDGYENAHPCLDAGVADAHIDHDGDAVLSGGERALGTDPCNPDSDGDVCGDGAELLLVPPTSPTDAWDFYSVPVPALLAAPNPGTTFSNGVVSASDAQAVFAYFKAGATSADAVYEQDLNGNGRKDGEEYDRRVLGPGLSGPPDGAIGAQDAQLAFAQFKRAYSC
jgi:hypothetical protein